MYLTKYYTPVRRADIIMRKDGLNPSRNKEVRKDESLVMELQEMSVSKWRSLLTKENSG